MIKQNIKIALFSILSCLIFWLILFNFTKIDICSRCLISLVDTPQISIESKLGSYIENNDVRKIKVIYGTQNFICDIYLIEASQDYYQYVINLPYSFDKSNQYIIANTIIDQMNIYKYLFAK